MSATKNSRFNGKRSSLIIASQSAFAMSLLGGKTINEIGFLKGMSDDDFEFNVVENPKKAGQMITTLVLTIEGNQYQVGVSKGFDANRAMEDPEWFLECEFRRTPRALLAEDGITQLTREVDGKTVGLLMDGLDGRPFAEILTIGKPSGITATNRTKAFAPLTVEEQAENAIKA